MNKYLLKILIVLVMTAPATYADTGHSKGHHGMGPMQGNANMPGRSGMSQMMEQMQSMQQQMEEMIATDNPDERQRLMQEHHQQMQAMMGTMQGMHGSNRMSGDQSSMQGEWMMAAFRQMEKRLDLMQTQLQQLLQKQE